MKSARRVLAFVLAVSASSFGWVPRAAAQPAAPRPHIVYIVSDDQGWKDVGFHGSDIKTPNIDQLAQGGARLEQFYAQPNVHAIAGRADDRPLPPSLRLANVGHSVGWHLWIGH